MRKNVNVGWGLSLIFESIPYPNPARQQDFVMGRSRVFENATAPMRKTARFGQSKGWGQTSTESVLTQRRRERWGENKRICSRLTPFAVVSGVSREQIRLSNF